MYLGHGDADMMHSDVLKQLLPPVSYDQQAPALGAELAGVGRALDDAMRSAEQLQLEMHADTCYATLPDWERVYGLPDPCVTIQQGFEQRRAALVSKVMASGGQNRLYFVELAKAMGYPDASVNEFQVMTCNSYCDAALNSASDLFVWQLVLPASTGGIFYMDCNSGCDSFLQSWGDEAIECRVNKLKPAHTTVIFAYP